MEDPKETTEPEYDPITEEDLEEIKKEPGDVTDVPQDVPDMEKLKNLQKMLESMPRDKAAELLQHLAQQTQMNPNGNTFSGVSKREMIKQRYQQKLKQKKLQRQTRTAAEHHKKKVLEKQQQKQEETEQEQKQEETEQEQDKKE